jgi:hypothetical protein
LLAKSIESIALTVLPQVAPLPSAQILLAGPWPVPVQKILCVAEVARGQSLLRYVHL